MEYRMLPRAQCCCGLACACGVYVLGLRRIVLRNREFWGASFVFWPGSADWVDVCSGEADSPVCVLAVVCPTGDSVQRICVTGFCRVLRYRLWVVRPVTTSSGVFVCDRENYIGRTKAGCQRWVGNCVERRGEVLHHMPKLDYLGLHSNNLTHIDDFRSLCIKIIILGRNPWDCVAELSWMGEADMSFQHDLTCATPTCRHGMAITVMSK